VSDLVGMAVREAFSPEIVERFGQLEDFPEDFAKFGALQGVSREWAERYWAAHWSLPSLQMGFEMLHRRVISQDDLNLLMRAQDIMPFWRDKLTAISFAPFTRVDIRRMHKLGILTAAQVQDAYKDIGYDDEKSALLRDFTVRLNAPKPAENPDELAALTRASILGFFRDGVINADRARTLLLDVGVSEQAAALFISSEEMDIERTDRKDQVALILEQSNAGILSFEDAQDQLSTLGLETVEQERAIIKLLRQEAARTRLPTRTRLDKMLEAGLITEIEFLATLQKQGFARVWAERELELIKRG